MNGLIVVAAGVVGGTIGGGVGLVAAMFWANLDGFDTLKWPAGGAVIGATGCVYLASEFLVN